MKKIYLLLLTLGVRLLAFILFRVIRVRFFPLFLILKFIQP